MNSYKKVIIGVITAATIIVAVASGYFVYQNMPEQRLKKQLSLGEKYLSELRYDEALICFDNVIEIEPMSIKAHIGTVMAADGKGDYDELLKRFNSAISVFNNYDTDSVGWTENLSDVISVYLIADKVYKDDLDRIIGFLEEGLAKTNNNEIRIRLKECYAKKAKGFYSDKDFEKTLEWYEKALLLNLEYEEIRNDRDKVIEEYIREYIAPASLDMAKTLLTKYSGSEYEDKFGGIPVDVDFEELEEEIENLEKELRFGRDFMAKVYAAMSNMDWDKVEKLYESDEVQEILNEMQSKSLIYSPDGYSEKVNGKGAGLYRYGDSDDRWFYFYYGDYLNGSREGNGLSYSFFGWESGKYSKAYSEGIWVNDAPNGSFITKEDYTYSDGVAHSDITGTYNKGLNNGDFYEECSVHNSDGDKTYHLKSHFENGIATDQFNQLPVNLKNSIREEHSAGNTIIAFDGDRLAVWQPKWFVNGLYEFGYEAREKYSLEMKY